MPFQPGNQEAKKAVQTANIPKRTIVTENVPLTVEALKAVMPKRQRHNVNGSIVDELNQLVTDPEARDVFRENLISYTSVLNDPKIRFPNYVEAVKYISYKLMGNTNQEAWIKTFPDRYKRLLKDKKDAMFIRSTVACYNRNKTVSLVREQAMIPTWLINQDLFQQAINTQATLMVAAKSEKVRTDAANSLLTHLKQPEATKLTLDVHVKEDDSIRELNMATLELVAQQRRMISSGAMNAKEVAEGTLITGDFKRIENNQE